MENLRIDEEKYFSSQEYLHTTQIKSLLSGYAKLKKDGKLAPLTNKTVPIDDEMQNDSQNYDVIMEQQLTADIIPYTIYDSKADTDDWVLVKYHSLFFIGITKDLSENKYYIKCMHECDQNQFKWPIHSDECW